MNREKFLPLTETTYYILLALLEPSHGYAVMQKIEELSKGNVRIAAGTLYGAVENLFKQKLIVPVRSDDQRRKKYQATELGRRILKLDCERMEHMVAITRAADWDNLTSEV